MEVFGWKLYLCSEVNKRSNTFITIHVEIVQQWCMHKILELIAVLNA